MSRLYLYGGAAVALVIISGLAWGLKQQLDLAESQRDTAQAHLSAVNDILAAERQNLREAESRAAEYQLQRDQSNESNEAMRACIADKSCGVRVNVVYRTVRDPDTRTCGAVEADAESQRELEQNYLSLDRELSLMEDNYRALQQELIVRSHPDYCRTKKAPIKGPR